MKIIIGVGNRQRRDDGFGAAVVERLLRDGSLRGSGAMFVVSDGEPSRLIQTWSHAELVVLIDAVRAVDLPGRWYELPPEEFAARHPTSSHGVSLVDTVELARALDRLPRTVVVLAAVGTDFGRGVGLSPALASAVAPVAARAAQLMLAGVQPQAMSV